MLIKPMPADLTKVCRTCSHYDPDLHVCCANDVVVSADVAKIKCCSDWNPKKICITCGYFNPDTNQCWPGHNMSEEESLTRTCESWELRREKQPVFGGTSLKELEEKQKELEKVLHIESDMPDIQNERAKALDRGAKQGMTLEALETVFAIACQQVPSMENRWMELKAEINIMFAQKWAAEDMPK